MRNKGEIQREIKNQRERETLAQVKGIVQTDMNLLSLVSVQTCRTFFNQWNMNMMRTIFMILFYSERKRFC